MRSIAIIGAGLAGAACANAFAHKGWRVVVYEQGATPAAGASGVPIAMFAPSTSSDDAPHSRLLRQGVHLLLHELRRLTDAGLLTSVGLHGIGLAWTERCRVMREWLAGERPARLGARLKTL
jgi:tRNA 5-methylaminomethyl-2-thiouridine biosynthesis bifunctional protein